MKRRQDRAAGRAIPKVHVTRAAIAAVAMSLAAGAVPARAQQSGDPSATQPATKASSSPIVESLVGKPQPALEVHKRPMHAAVRPPVRRHNVRSRHAPLALDRPALAGVELLAPLPRPEQPPHFVVTAPAYPLETLAAAFLTPPPPIVCHDVRRDPNRPDPHLYRERTVACEPDNP